MFLDFPEMDIGRVGGGQRKAKRKLDVALIQSIVRKGVVNDLVADYGHLIVDECHHLPAASFEQVARRAKAKYVLGLSATVARKDGHHPIITMQCGPVRLIKSRLRNRPISVRFGIPSSFVRRPSKLRRSADRRDQRIRFKKLCDSITDSEMRNGAICDDVVAATKDGRSPLVLTERTEHVDRLAERLQSHTRHVIILKGGMRKKALNAAISRIQSIPDDESRIIVATGKYSARGSMTHGWTHCF